ncbi:glycosyl transferase family 1 [Marinitoga sp. 1135]|uniref:glycosyltransferase family 4 protein n=1 Tax=Marinitoga sp. 1135 TaxID=1643333 RepID=UPI00158675AF|nr:glycosyltransferase family 4 protein [Marinitoga sp. 1135]NUU95823.1 glycosyl transferase family 1 [Marinitoga sp. 1135]
MKILFVTQHFYPEQFRINDIFFELVKRGHEVTVLTGLPNYPSGKIPKEYKFFRNRIQNINGVKIVRVPLISRGKSLFKLALNYISFAITSSIGSIFLKKDFDIIIGHQTSPITQVLGGVILKKITKKPFIIYCFDLWPASLETAKLTPDNPIYKIFSKISNWIYKQANYIFMSSYSFEKYFKEYHKIKNNLIYFPMYAENIFESNEEDNIDNAYSKSFNLLFAGNIGKMQSTETIVKAAKELEEYEDILFHIVGDGSEKQNMEQLAKKLKLKNIIFHGYHPVEKMKYFYGFANAFLVTLKDNKIISYTLPGKVQSYMAFGKPIIGAINGETNEIIQKANCGLCGPAEDYKTLANNILKLYKNPHLADLYGINARKYYEKNFLRNLYFQKLECMLEKAIKNEDIKECK